MTLMEPLATSPEAGRPSASTSLDTGRIWNTLVMAYREACRLELTGAHAASIDLLSAKVKPLTLAWSSRIPLTVAEKKALLREMFLEQRVRMQRQVAAEQAKRSPSPSLAPAASRRGIPVDDIPAMIDAVQAAQRPLLAS